MTMFDEMEVGIHLPIGNLNVPSPDISTKDTMSQAVDHKYHHHDEESQLYSQKISLPLQR